MNPEQSVSYNSSGGSGRNMLLPIVLVILLIACLGFGVSQYLKVQDYKKNTDKKVNQAVALKLPQLQTQAQAAFDAANTYQYQGSPTYGSVTFRYPKTWSAYVDTSDQNEPINGYFHPSVVPGVQTKTAFALRLELKAVDYGQALQQFQSQIQTGTVKARAYVPPKMNGVANVQPGTLLSGAINSSNPTQTGTMLAIKVRDKTLEIYTESNDYLSDFTGIILAGLTFAP